MKRDLVIASLFLSMLLVAPAFAYTGSVDFPELFKYSDQKNANLETTLLSISISFKDNSVPITQELLAAIMATLDKEVGSNYLPIEENGDYGAGTDCTYKISGYCRSTPYEGGVDYKGRGYIQVTGKSNYQTYCGPDCIGASTPKLDVCGCKNQWDCTVTDMAICPQIKALQPDYAARIFASYYIKSPTGKNLVSLSNSKSYSDVGKAINGGEAYASDFNNVANAYLTLFSNNPDKTSSLLTWLNSGTSAAAAGASNMGTQSGSIIGDWTLHWKWNNQIPNDCTPTLSIHNDGTCTWASDPEIGKWSQNMDNVRFETDRVVYEGTIKKDTMRGTITGIRTGHQGYWSAERLA